MPSGWDWGPPTAMSWPVLRIRISQGDPAAHAEASRRLRQDAVEQARVDAIYAAIIDGEMMRTLDGHS